LITPTSEAASLSLVFRPAKAIMGASVNATGKGWTPNQVVTITISSKVVATVVASSTGRVTVIFTVPQLAAGTYSATVSQGSNSLTTSFTVLSRAHITLKPTSGVPGSTTTVTGKHFADNSKLTISFNNKKQAITASTNSTGGFQVSLTIPSTAVAGSYAVTVKDALNYTSSAAFSVT